MSIHLSVITSNGCIPLLSRTFDSTGKQQDKIPFAHISTLNAINLYISNINQGEIYSASTENSKIYWRSVHSITLIIILNQSSKINENTNQSNSINIRCSKFTDKSLKNLTTLIYNLILMFCTKDELINKHIERIKFKIKTCYFVIDYLIESFIKKSNFTIESNCLEYKLDTSKCTKQLDDLINSLSIEADSQFVCLNVDLKCVNATQNYKDKLQSTIDGQLINLILQAKLAKDDEDLFEIEILLPQNCPDLPSKLIYAKLSKHCSSIMLCGDKLDSLDSIRALIEPLKRHPQNIQLFNELETKTFINSDYFVNDRVINFAYFNFNQKFYFKNGIFCREKISNTITFMQSFDYEDDKEQFIVYSNCKLYAIYRKLESHLVLIMFPKSMNLNEIQKNGLKTYNEILKMKKKLFTSNKN